MRKSFTKIRNRLHSEEGATLILALLFFVLSAFFGITILSAATAASGRLKGLREEQQRFYNAESAASYLLSALEPYSVSAAGAAAGKKFYAIQTEEIKTSTEDNKNGTKDADGHPEKVEVTTYTFSSIFWNDNGEKKTDGSYRELNGGDILLMNMLSSPYTSEDQADHITNFAGKNKLDGRSYEDREDNSDTEKQELDEALNLWSLPFFSGDEYKKLTRELELDPVSSGTAGTGSASSTGIKKIPLRATILGNGKFTIELNYTEDSSKNGDYPMTISGQLAATVRTEKSSGTGSSSVYRKFYEITIRNLQVMKSEGA